MKGDLQRNVNMFSSLVAIVGGIIVTIAAVFLFIHQKLSLGLFILASLLFGGGVFFGVSMLQAQPNNVVINFKLLSKNQKTIFVIYGLIFFVGIIWFLFQPDASIYLKATVFGLSIFLIVKMFLKKNINR